MTEKENKELEQARTVYDVLAEHENTQLALKVAAGYENLALMDELRKKFQVNKEEVKKAA